MDKTEDIFGTLRELEQRGARAALVVVVPGDCEEGAAVSQAAGVGQPSTSIVLRQAAAREQEQPLAAEGWVRTDVAVVEEENEQGRD